MYKTRKASGCTPICPQEPWASLPRPYSSTDTCEVNNLGAASTFILDSLYPNLRLWLLPQTATGGLAAARSALIRATAGRGPVLLMDDDAKCWALTVSNAIGSGSLQHPTRPPECVVSPTECSLGDVTCVGGIRCSLFL